MEAQAEYMTDIQKPWLELLDFKGKKTEVMSNESSKLFLAATMCELSGKDSTVIDKALASEFPVG